MRRAWIVAAVAALAIAGCGSSKSSTSGGSTSTPASGGSTSTPASGGSTSTPSSGESSAGHTSEWTAADTTGAENDLNNESKGEHLSAAFKGCLIKGVEEKFSPAEYKKDSSEDKEADKARPVAEACAKKYPPTAYSVAVGGYFPAWATRSIRRFHVRVCPTSARERTYASR